MKPIAQTDLKPQIAEAMNVFRDAVEAFRNTVSECTNDPPAGGHVVLAVLANQVGREMSIMGALHQSDDRELAVSIASNMRTGRQEADRAIAEEVRAGMH